MSLEVGQRGAPVVALQRTSPASRTDGETPAAATSPSSETTSTKPQRTGIAAVTLGDIWDGICNFAKSAFNAVVSFFGKLFAPSQPDPLDADSAAIAKAYNLLPTKENVQAFLAEAQGYEKEGAIGPGSSADSVKAIQEALKKRGYNLQATGDFDQATCTAVMDFKSRNGLHQTYKSADGSYAVNEYADKATMTMLQTTPTTPTAPTVPTTPTTPTVPTVPTTPNTSTVPTVPTVPTTPTTPTTSTAAVRGDEAIIKQYNLLPTKENVDAFLAQTQAYKSNGTLGPGIEEPADIKEMQTILSKLGYQVKLNGVYDEATAAAVLKFKKDVGIHESYKLADGTFAVNQYADPATLAKLLERVEAKDKEEKKKNESAKAPAASQPATSNTSGAYTIQKGDTLWKIAQVKLGNGNRWREIYDLNRDVIGGNPNVIQAGAQIKLPGGASAPASKPASSNGAIKKPSVISMPSPNYGSRPGGEGDISAIVLHHTAGGSSAQNIGSYFQNPTAEVSAHYTIGKDGAIVQSVADGKRAWHAGTSAFQGRDDVNDFSLGIELVNEGNNSDPFTDAQYNALIELVAWMCKTYNIPVDRITGHRNICTPKGRKTDPADNFDWNRVRNGVNARL